MSLVIHSGCPTSHWAAPSTYTAPYVVAAAFSHPAIVASDEGGAEASQNGDTRMIVALGRPARSRASVVVIAVCSAAGFWLMSVRSLRPPATTTTSGLAATAQVAMSGIDGQVGSPHPLSPDVAR